MKRRRWRDREDGLCAILLEDYEPALDIDRLKEIHWWCRFCDGRNGGGAIQHGTSRHRGRRRSVASTHELYASWDAHEATEGHQSTVRTQRLIDHVTNLAVGDFR